MFCVTITIIFYMVIKLWSNESVSNITFLAIGLRRGNAIASIGGGGETRWLLLARVVILVHAATRVNGSGRRKVQPLQRTWCWERRWRGRGVGGAVWAWPLRRRPTAWETQLHESQEKLLQWNYVMLQEITFVVFCLNQWRMHATWFLLQICRHVWIIISFYFANCSLC